MRREPLRDAVALGTVPFLGVWMLWIVPPPLPLAWGNRVEPIRQARAPQPERPRRHSASAQALYQARCARCHEADGTSRDLHASVPGAPDFTDPHWHQRRNTTQLIVSILDGKGTRMPAFGGKLTRAEARELVTYLRDFAPASPTSSEAPADDFETRFRELEEEFQRLSQQLDKLSPRRK